MGRLLLSLIHNQNNRIMESIFKAEPRRHLQRMKELAKFGHNPNGHLNNQYHLQYEDTQEFEVITVKIKKK